jgi:hypothetical protein
MTSDHEHSYAQHVQLLLASYYASLLGDQSRPGFAHTAFAMAVSEMQFPLLVVIAPSASDYECLQAFQKAHRLHRDRLAAITRDALSSNTGNDNDNDNNNNKKKRLKEEMQKAPRYQPRKDLQLEVLGVLRLNTELLLETLYDKKFPESKVVDVSELIARFLDKVLGEHSERLGAGDVDLGLSADETTTTTTTTSTETNEMKSPFFPGAAMAVDRQWQTSTNGNGEPTAPI